MRAFATLFIVGVALCDIVTTDIITTQTGWDADIKKQSKLQNKYYMDRNFTAMGNMYTNDCVIMPPGSGQITGRGVVSSLYALMWEIGAGNMTSVPQKVVAYNNRMAAEWGVAFVKTSNKTTMDIVKYARIWKRVNGQPKIYTDIWNSCVRRL